MKAGSISLWLFCFALKQVILVLLALAIMAIFWAITGQASPAPITLIYTLVLGNLTSMAVDYAGTGCSRRWYFWRSLMLLVITIPVAVLIATAIVFEVVPPAMLQPGARTSFWTYLLTGWKFPFVASVIFAGSYFGYEAARRRLESRHRQVQQTLETKLAEHEIDLAELQQARDIQRGLLPKEIPQVAEFAIAGAWEPARVVGGDYYDVIPLGRDKLAVCIADVAGKGISAALLMANVQAAVRAFASEGTPPSRVCTQLNSVLCTNTAPEKFVTLFYGVLDAKARTLQYTNAGHLRPVLLGENGKAVHLENGGALLGVFPDWKYEDSLVQFARGDLLLLFTDGITEAEAPDGEEFGEERLLAATRSAREHPLQGVQLDVLSHVKEFCHAQLSDDATLLMIGASAERDRELIRGKNADEIVCVGVRS